MKKPLTILYQPLTYYSYLGWAWLFIFGFLSITFVLEQGVWRTFSIPAFMLYIFFIITIYLIFKMKMKITDEMIILKRPFLFREEQFNLKTTKIVKSRFGVTLEGKTGEKLSLIVLPFQAKKLLQIKNGK